MKCEGCTVGKEDGRNKWWNKDGMGWGHFLNFLKGRRGDTNTMVDDMNTFLPSFFIGESDLCLDWVEPTFGLKATNNNQL